MRSDELVERAQRGVPGAFDELYYAYVDRVHRQLAALVGPSSDLEDLVQQVFVQVHQNLPRFRGDAAFPTWLHRLVLNVGLMHVRSAAVRRQKASVELPLELPSQDGSGPERAYARTEARAALYAVLAQLDDKKRVAFILYEIEGHTLEEIALLLDTSINTVAARVRTARLEVRRGLERRLRVVAEGAA